MKVNIEDVLKAVDYKIVFGEYINIITNPLYEIYLIGNKTPNDAEFGEKIRKFVNKYYNDERK